MKISSYYVLGALALSSIWNTSQAAPVGMIAHLSGDLAALNGGKKTPLRLLSRVEEGTTIVSGPNASAVLVLFGNGTRYQIGARARVDVGAKSVAGARPLAALSGPSAGAAQLLGQARVGAVLSRSGSSFQRITPNSKGYFIGASPRFDWTPIAGAALYSFTLFDSADNVIWNISTDQTGAAYSGSVALAERKPYLWKLSGFGDSGKPLDQSRWGIVTPLSSDDAATLDGLVTTLSAEPQSKTDQSALWMLVETYRSFGVCNNALELLDSELLQGEKSVGSVRSQILASLSPFTRALATRNTQTAATR
ncbi:MAG TPA: hypothetical protein VGB45_16755 [Abditibacterium sp.]|jgi:hypothetical protein